MALLAKLRHLAHQCDFQKLDSTLLDQFVLGQNNEWLQYKMASTDNMC